MRIFVTGATGVLGMRLVPLLVGAGHDVAGMTRSTEKAATLREQGAEPVLCDVFAVEALARAVTGFRPYTVIDELTDLPDAAADVSAFRERNDRMRTEGTGNLLAAARHAGVARFISQSIAWQHPDEQARAAVALHEEMVLDYPGVVLRYGVLYGPDTYYPSDRPPPPRIHVDDAARRTLHALNVSTGVLVLVEERPDGRQR